MATTLYDPASGWKSHFLAARTDAAGSAVDDAGGEDLRSILDAFFTEGVVTPATGFQVVEDSPTGMTVVIGSGSAKSDHALIDGDVAGQGAYLVRMEDATVDLTVPAADLSNPRIDEVYLVVQDNAYDSSSRVLPRIAYRDGTPASSPSAPGPDAAWDAYLLVATISVGAGVTEITDSDITDERVGAKVVLANGSTVGPGNLDFGNIEIVANGTGVLFYQGSTLLATLDEVDLNMLGRDISNVGDVDGVDVSVHSHNGTDSASLGANTVGNTQMGNAAVDTAELVDGAVTAPKVDGAAIGGFIDFEVVTDNTGPTLTSSFQTVITTTYSPPAGWSGYKLIVLGSVAIDVSGVDPATIEARCVVDGTNGTAFVLDGNTVANDAVSLTPVQTRGSLSGNTVVKVEAKHNDSTSLVMASSMTIVAVRTS